MSVDVNTFLRTPSGPIPIAEVQRYDGQVNYVEGSIVLDVDGCELLSHDLWDDVNWLWPFVVQAVDEALRTGFGEFYFPDQPILFEDVSKGDPDRLAEQAMGLLADVMDSPEATEEQARQAGIIGMAAATSLEDDISVADLSADGDPEAVGGGQA